MSLQLDERTIDAIACRVVEQLRATAGESTSSSLVDAAELARLLGVDRSWIYAHADELGAVRLGTGAKPRLRFDVEVAKAAHGCRASAPADAELGPPSPARARRRARRGARPGVLRSRPATIPPAKDLP